MPTTTNTIQAQQPGSGNSSKQGTSRRVRSTNDPSQMSMLPIFEASHSAISSQASADGATPFGLPDGQTIGLSGREALHANPSARQESVSGKTTNDTSHRSGSISSYSAALQSFLANRLRTRSESAGSMIYKTGSKMAATPADRPFLQLQASAPRTSESGSTLEASGWVTPTTRDWKDSGTDIKPRADGTERFDQLPRQANLAGWPTPCASNGETGMTSTRGDTGKVSSALPAQANLAGWPTPTVQDGKHGVPTERDLETLRDSGMLWFATPTMAGWPTARATDGDKNVRTLEGAMQEIERKGGPQDMAQAAAIAGPARLTASGHLLTGSTAAMGNGGQLNPAHSRWLMGFPAEWDSCGATAMQSSRRSPKPSSKASKKPRQH